MSAPTAYWQQRAAASPIRYPAAKSQPGRYAGLHPRDQLLDPLVDRAERVLAQHRPLSLVVQLEVDPVDGKVAPLLLGPADELAAELGPRRLRRDRLGLEDVDVAGRPLHRPGPLQQVVQAAAAVHVVVGQVELGPRRRGRREVVAGPVE